MNDTFVTFHGYAGGEVRHRTVRDVTVATLRVASTPRIRRDGDWVDGETTWYSVTAWRSLADNLQASVRKGDPVIVHGRLRSETWKAEDGTVSTTLHVDASLVGHDLTRGWSHFIKPPRRPEQVGDAGVRPEQPGDRPDAEAPDAVAEGPGAHDVAA